MYTTCGSLHETIAGNYERWLGEHIGNEELIHEVDSILKAAISEACTYDNVHESDPINDLIRHIDQLACFSSEWDRGFRSNVPSYYTLISSNCINCTVFSYLFHGTPVILLIDPKYVNEFKWECLRDVLPFTNLQHIAIKVDDYMNGSEPDNPPNRAVGKLWCLESDSFYAVIQEGHSYEEIEDGWPITTTDYYEKYYLLKETDTMNMKKQEWYSQPKLSREEASLGFLQKRDRYNQLKLSRNKAWSSKNNKENVIQRKKGKRSLLERFLNGK